MVLEAVLKVSVVANHLSDLFVGEEVSPLKVVNHLLYQILNDANTFLLDSDYSTLAMTVMVKLCNEV